MGLDRSFKDSADLQGLQGDAIIDLMILDLLPLDPTISSQERYIRFVNWVVNDGQPVQYGGLTYTAVPFKATGFSLQTDGVPPTPSLTISNIGLEFTALVNRWDDLVGAKLTRRRVLARYLDSSSSPDANAHWPDELWTVQQKETENKLFVSFKLSTAFDLDGITLPRRRALRYTCPWIYRGEGCDYIGPPVANAKDEPLTSSADPLTQAVITSRTALINARIARAAAEAAYSLAAARTKNSVATQAYWAAEVSKGPQWLFAEERYSMGAYPESGSDLYGVVNDSGSVTAYWNQTVVSLNYEYRRGPDVAKRRPSYAYAPWAILYTIQRWVEDTVTYAAAQAAYASAQTDLSEATADETAKKTVFDAAQSTYMTANAQYKAAVAAWGAASSPSTAGDVCGKRLASCRLRFYDPATDAYDSLPFGAFPGLTT